MTMQISKEMNEFKAQLLKIYSELRPLIPTLQDKDLCEDKNFKKCFCIKHILMKTYSDEDAYEVAEHLAKQDNYDAQKFIDRTDVKITIKEDMTMETQFFFDGQGDFNNDTIESDK